VTIGAKVVVENHAVTVTKGDLELVYSQTDFF